MHHIISNINNPINLQQYIDNRDGCKQVGLKSFTYTQGWYNIGNEIVQMTGDRPFHIEPGFYSFQQISDIFQSLKIILTVNETNGIVTLVTPTELKISKGLKSMLGLGNKRRFSPNLYHVGDRPVDFAVVKSLYLHLKQLNTSLNYFDGAPSSILAVVPIANRVFGDIVTMRFEHPEYKCLTNNALTELTLEVRDEFNNRIDNHGLPMTAVLEII